MGNCDEEDGATSGGAATFHTPVQETPAAGPSACVRPREKNGGGGKAGNRDEEEGATSGGSATFHASSQETTAAGPSARVRPMVKGGDGDKAGDHGVDTREGVEQAILSTCGERTAMDEAGSYGFGTWRPETSNTEETSGGAATFHATGSREPRRPARAPA